MGKSWKQGRKSLYVSTKVESLLNMHGLFCHFTGNDRWSGSRWRRWNQRTRISSNYEENKSLLVNTFPVKTVWSSVGWKLYISHLNTITRNYFILLKTCCYFSKVSNCYRTRSTNFVNKKKGFCENRSKKFFFVWKINIVAELRKWTFQDWPNYNISVLILKLCVRVRFIWRAESSLLANYKC